MRDLIDRQAAIDFIDAGHFCNPNEPRWSDNEIINFLKSRPSAQRDGTDTNVGGTIYRQAAIDALHMHLMYRMGTASNKKRLDEWINNLPSAQPEPCEDAVSRTFMYELGATCIAKPDGNGNLIALGRIDMLPPVTPKRKTGKWNFIGNQMFECSECGTCYTQSQFYQMRVRISDTEFPKFCPNCGADMRGEQDG